jgi:hypothetical protein
MKLARMALLFLGSTGSTLSIARAVRVADDPQQIVDCGTTAVGQENYSQRGTYCSSHYGDPHQDDDEALQDANDDFMKWLEDSFACGGCPVPQTGCTPSWGTIPSPPFSAANCTFSLGGSCQGNPFKVLVIANCTNNIIWAYACDGCHGEN